MSVHPPPQGRLRVSIDSRLDQVFMVGYAVRGICTQLGMDRIVAFRLELAVVESINNAIKHGRAGRIDIVLSDDPECIHLEILDNGSGAPDSFRNKTGIGLRIMQYRAGIIGGTCAFESTPGGFIVRTAIRKEFIETYL